MRTFYQRLLDVTFTLTSGTFDGKNTVLKIPGLRVSATVKVGAQGLSDLECEIYGLKKDVIKRLMGVHLAAATPWQKDRNGIKLEVYSSVDDTRYVLFNGEIFVAIADFNNVPEVPLRVTASDTYGKQSIVLQPKTFAGAAKVSDIMAYLAGQCGCVLENNGVDDSFVLRDYTVQGSAVQAIEETARAAQIDWNFLGQGTIQTDEAPSGVLVICKKGVTRKDATSEIHEANGMVGYPVLTTENVHVKCLFNPRYWKSNRVRLFASEEMDILNGEYIIQNVKHTVHSELPGGQWVSELTLGWLPGQEVKQ